MSSLTIPLLIRKVDLLTLRLFLVAIEEQKIGRAAIRENIAPSAVTKRIQDLEQVVGTKLLQRTPKGVEPTKTGKVLQTKLETIFSTLEDARRELSMFSEGVRGHVRLATTASVIIQFLAAELEDFVRTFQEIEIEIEEDLNTEVVRLLRAGEVDLAVIVRTFQVELDEFEILPYRRDDLVVIAPVSHPFSARSCVTLEDILEERFIAINASTSLMQQLHGLARDRDRDLKVSYRVNSVEVARCLVKAGFGISIQPECMLPEGYSGAVTKIAIDEPWAKRKLELAYLKDRPLSAAAQQLVNQLTEGPESEGSNS
ncbi:LysR family transcriptional regulator [Sedimentitalea sp.]|uniref:LysR family transcriptional regulator n=1 Tax=Sedimentitalea sp. TaxID=2048915 RepID=UPI003298C188